ncbi:unnamed protein product [marine sediment metagenome]|uniref:Uncharacterized protein n=1 Tax=marine sediment metagenome TaxID=412755 RepID=X1FTR8_9ZZZZ
MSENKPRVYVVTSGEYSSYSIEGVFTHKFLAEKLVDKLKEILQRPPMVLQDRVRTEEFFLNLPIDEFEVTTVRMSFEGSVLEVLHSVGRDTGAHAFDQPGNLMWSIYGKDEERAIKVANEKRAQLIANDLWGVDDSQLEEYIEIC